MAASGTEIITRKNLASKLVQEIAKNGDEIPEKYIHKNGYPEAIDDPDLWRNNLLIDLSLLCTSSTSELSKLRSPLSQWGCFQVINHGIESRFLEELFEVCKEFFALPLEEKLKCYSPNEIFQGYGTDALYSGTQIINWNDRLFLYLRPKQKVTPQCWPHKPHKFSGLIDEYSTKLTRLNEQICKAMAKSLNIEENCLSFGKEGPKIGRFNLYPRCPIPNKILGSKPHSDASSLTYLLPEKHVEGLQILKDDQWYNVLVIPAAIFVNFGDLGEVITNGLFKSAIHRVVPNAVQDRISVAMFFFPDDDQEIKPLSELVTVHQPQVYKKFHISEFEQKLMEHFAKGSRTLDAFQV